LSKEPSTSSDRALAVGVGPGLPGVLWPVIKDLAAPKPWVYWTDLAISVGAFWIGLCVLHLAASPLAAAAGACVAVLALYRAASFMHELVHLPPGAVPGFRTAWNLVCGAPLMLPSRLYASHVDHHSRHVFGTERDPEYLPLQRHPWSGLAALLLAALLALPMLWLRSALLLPLAALLPRLRGTVQARASSISMHGRYRPPPQVARDAGNPLRRLDEAAASVSAWTWVVLAAMGGATTQFVLSFALVALAALLVNMARTCVAHRYAHGNEPVSMEEQLRDSVTLDLGAWAALAAPVGLRFHALHHLFPLLPYHALAQAHKRLMQHGHTVAGLYRSTCWPPAQAPREEAERPVDPERTTP
jgi:fatty acid desaturase